MQIVAVLAVRNEAAYLGNALRYLMRNGINFVVIDNDSEDETAAVARRQEFSGSLIDFVRVPFAGAYDWTRLLHAKMAIIGNLNADWVIHHDADEIMHSYREGETLAEAIARIDAGNHNVIDLNEFVFLPVDHSYRPDLEQRMRYYYFFEPHPRRLMRAWKPACGLNMLESGGHILNGADIRIAPEQFALRHYIFRDQKHALTKYSDRIFAAGDRAKGWHGNRIGNPTHKFQFPPRSLLQRLTHQGSRRFDRSRPVAAHYWQWPDAAGAANPSLMRFLRRRFLP